MTATRITAPARRDLEPIHDAHRKTVGKIAPVATTLTTAAYADAERAVGQAKASRLIVAGQPRHALITLIVTVENQARIEGIGGILLPYRLEAVTR